MFLSLSPCIEINAQLNRVKSNTCTALMQCLEAATRCLSLGMTIVHGGSHRNAYQLTRQRNPIVKPSLLSTHRR